MIYNQKRLLNLVTIIGMIFFMTVTALSPQETDTLTEIMSRGEIVLLEQSEPSVETTAIVEPPIGTLEDDLNNAYFDVPLSTDLQDHIFELCEKTGLDASMVVAMIFVESSYRSYLIGDSGKSYGLMQIQPRWHSERMSALGCDDLLDPYQNIIVGIDYISELYTYGGKQRTTDWVLMAYNGGPSYANKKTANGEVTHYVNKVYNKQASLTEV